MKHRLEVLASRTIIAIEGDVDLQSSPEARRILLEAVDGHAHVVVDLSGVSYIDSSGIASLIEAMQLSRKRGSLFALAAVSDAALRVLQLARLDRVFTIHATLDPEG